MIIKIQRNLRECKKVKLYDKVTSHRLKALPIYNK
jgi:hypothetical protein